MINNKNILEDVELLKDDLIKTRRYLHENPELTKCEFETSKFLKEEIEKLGLQIHSVEGTGFYAVLDTHKKGKTLAIRADIDALPVKESNTNLKREKVSVSKKEGVMHACGHDGHMSMLLSAAKILKENVNNLKGKIVFVFEEGEEQGTGIEQMIEALKDLNIDAVYGTHLTSFMDTGKISVDAGPVMAGAALVKFDVIGKGGHGSRPDLSISPIFPAANILTGLSSAWVNQVDVTKTVTLGIGSINGGSNLAPNVIPDKVEITGTLRFFDMDEGYKAMDIIENVAENTAKAHNCKIDFKKDNKVVAKPVINDENLSKLAKNAIENILPGSIEENVTWFASESFSNYIEIAPSLFAFVGTRNTELGSGAEHHNEKFDLDENSLIFGTIAAVKFASDYLSEE